MSEARLWICNRRQSRIALNVGVLSGQFRRERLICEPQGILLASVADLPTLLAPRV